MLLLNLDRFYLTNVKTIHVFEKIFDLLKYLVCFLFKQIGVWLMTTDFAKRLDY